VYGVSVSFTPGAGPQKSSQRHGVVWLSPTAATNVCCNVCGAGGLSVPQVGMASTLGHTASSVMDNTMRPPIGLK
jgi:hypothetical protein